MILNKTKQTEYRSNCNNNNNNDRKNNTQTGWKTARDPPRVKVK